MGQEQRSRKGDRKIRILFVSQFVQPSDQPGANRTWDLLKYFRQEGHGIELITSAVHYLDDKPPQGMEGRKMREYDRDGVHVIEVYSVPRFRKTIKRRMLNYLSFAFYSFLAGTRRPKPDLVIASVQPIFVGPVGYLLAVLNRAAFLLEVRDVWPDAAIALGILRSRMVIYLSRLLERFLYLRAQKIVALTPGIARHIAGKGIARDKITVIPNGFSRELFDSKNAGRNVRQELGLDSGFIVMYTGAFGRIANLDTALRAAEILRDEDTCIHFVLVGEGDQKEKLRQWAQERNLYNVTFVPLQPKNDIPAFLEAADVCIMTLPKGEFWRLFLQNKFFDYLGSARPIVAAVEGDQKEVIEEARAGLVVEPEDHHALAEAILKLSQDPALCAQLGENGRRYAEEHFLRRDLLARYGDLVASMMEGRVST